MSPEADAPVRPSAAAAGAKQRRASITVFAIVATLTSIGIVAMAAAARIQSYRVAPLLLVPAVWAGYFLRRRLELHPAHFALLCGALLLHMMGAFGYYQRSPFPHSFDIYVHFYFAFAATFPVERMIRRKLGWRRGSARAATLIAIMAAGALHEVMEYATLLLGEQSAMLKRGSHPWDTNRDLTSNLLGCAAALLLSALASRASRSRRDRLAI